MLKQFADYDVESFVYVILWITRRYATNPKGGLHLVSNLENWIQSDPGNCARAKLESLVNPGDPTDAHTNEVQELLVIDLCTLTGQRIQSKQSLPTEERRQELLQKLGRREANSDGGVETTANAKVERPFVGAMPAHDPLRDKRTYDQYLDTVKSALGVDGRALFEDEVPLETPGIHAMD